MVNSNESGIPETFIEQVKEALENLYDFPALQRSPLAQMFEGQEPNSSGAHRLRRMLVEAVETLSPGHDVANSSGAARIYHLVYLHYVGGQTLQEAALEVGLSLRQAYRDLRRGQERVSAVLWYSPERKSAAAAAQDSTQTDIKRLEGSASTVPLQAMLDSALRAVQRLAEQNGVSLDVQMPEESPLVTTNPAIAQQVLTHILSRVIQQIAPPTLDVSVQNGAQILLRYPAAGVPQIEPVIEQMMGQIRWTLQSRASGDGQQLVIRTAQEGALLLLIDDNEGLVELLDHYLTGNTYRVVAVHNGEDGLRMAQQMRPDVIVLDLMMPGMDGWELLQRLRTVSETAAIPVVICSVINDPELAYSLGASKFVAKPVTRERLLDVLRELQEDTN